MKKLNKQEIQKSILQILKDFHQYCVEHDLKYYMFYGTLLGAVRHHGFIPWDDDIDVVMTRKDCEKLVAIFQKQPMSNHYRLQTTNDEQYHLPFIKIYDTNTKVMGKTSQHDQQLWIDIFILDDVSENNDEYNKQNQQTYQDMLWLMTSLSKWFTGTTLARRIYKTPILLLAKIIGPKYFCQRLVKNSQQYHGETKYVSNISFPIRHEPRIDKADLEQPCLLKFEDAEFYTVNRYTEYLTGLYGDYMQLPPENKRFGHMMDAYILEEEDEK